MVSVNFYFVQAATTKYHRLDGLEKKTEIYFSQLLGLKSEIRVPDGQVQVGAPFQAVNCPLLTVSLRGGRSKGTLWVSCIRALIIHKGSVPS